MIDTLKKLDIDITLFFNSFHNDFFDSVMLWVTNKHSWIFFYVILIAIMFWKYRQNGFFLLIILVVIITISELFSSSFMKPFFARLRPCHDPNIQSLHNIGGCGGKYGFVSAHAANAFAAATFIWLILKPIFKYSWLMFVWAGLIAYSRVYVGVHFFGDITTGAIIGTVISATIIQLSKQNPTKKFLNIIPK